MFDKNTELLTNSGWKLIKNIEPSDTLLSLGDNDSIEYINHGGIITQEYSGPCLQFSGRSFEIVVTPPQIMLVKEFRSDDYSFTQAASINFYQFNFKNSGFWRKASKFKRKNIKEWLNFLGFWYGDGYKVTRTTTNVGYVVGFNIKKERKIKYLTELMEKLNIEYKSYGDKHGRTRIFITNKELHTMLSGDSHTKKIPKFLLDCSAQEILWFLEGYINADGNVNKETGKITIYSCNKEIIDDLQVLFVLCGFSGSVATRPPRLSTIRGGLVKGGAQHTLSVFKAQKTFQLTKKHVSQLDYEGQVYGVSLSPRTPVYARRVTLGGSSSPIWVGPY